MAWLVKVEEEKALPVYYADLSTQPLFRVLWHIEQGFHSTSPKFPPIQDLHCWNHSLPFVVLAGDSYFGKEVGNKSFIPFTIEADPGLEVSIYNTLKCPL